MSRCSLCTASASGLVEVHSIFSKDTMGSSHAVNKKQFKIKTAGNIRGCIAFGEQACVLYVYIVWNKLNFHPNGNAGELLKLFQVF